MRKGAGGGPCGGGSFAEKLNNLFATVTSAEGREYSNEHVASAITADGVPISQSYIWQLRKGIKDNPTLKHVQALADSFGVPPAYFFDEAVTDQVGQRLAELKAEQQRLTEIAESSEAQMMALRAGELSRKRRRQVMDLLDVVYRLEQAERGDAYG
ncbi:helix-turn-helix domain-containing protein [Nocardia transvalensis]|uniref:helix-turn-helix domain-containing protein n=1 Tax=Nocardia transvalensis TaxID=37333 RepID=UPI0018930DBF|nr:helix-turn-helix domain-containing protein [Nocardia transvalensis]MBF6332434.1 helix-turn-helix transcriptional regulator [Nocardia transvalensis]